MHTEKSSTQQRSCIALRTKKLQAVRVRARPHRAGNRATLGERAESLPKTRQPVHINAGAKQPALHPGCQRRSLGATRGTEPPRATRKSFGGPALQHAADSSSQRPHEGWAAKGPRWAGRTPAPGWHPTEDRADSAENQADSGDSQRRSSCVASHWPAGPPGARSPAAGLELGQASRGPATAVARRKPLDASWAAAYDPWHFEGTTSRFLGSRQRGIFARPTARSPRARDRQPGAPKLPRPTQKFAPHWKPRSEETLVPQR